MSKKLEIKMVQVWISDDDLRNIKLVKKMLNNNVPRTDFNKHIIVSFEDAVNDFEQEMNDNGQVFKLNK